MGKRKSRSRARPWLTGMVSSSSSTVGPSYHGVWVLRSTTLSPLSAEIGTAIGSSMPSSRAFASKVVRMESKTSWE